MSAMTTVRDMHLQFLADCLTAARTRSGGEVTSHAALASAAGVSSSTLYRFMKEPSRKKLAAGTISRLSLLTGVPKPGGAKPGAAMDDGTKRTFIVQDVAMAFAGLEPGDEVEVLEGVEPQPGDIVVAIEYSNDGRRSRVLVRSLHPPFLAAATQDTALLKPILITPDIKIVGKVWKYYRERELP